MTIRKLTTAVTAFALASAGTGTALASGGGRDHAEDNAPAPAAGAARAPRIVEIEAKAVAGGKLRLNAEVQRRGAKVTSVRVRYRGRSAPMKHLRGATWQRTVRARGGDGRDDVVRLTVKACAGSKCAVRTVRDDA
jgi:hypothetical protein